MTRVLVTGASGFVGRILCNALVDEGCEVIGTSRRDSSRPLQQGVTMRHVADQHSTSGWTPIVEGTDCVVHLAARVHVMQEQANDPLREFRRANVDVTAALGEQAAAAGVRRLVYVSTIKVLGESRPGEAYRATDLPSPQDPYAVSKYEAECALRDIEARTGLQVTILRPPLIHGPGVGGNLRRVFSLVQRRIPVPLGSVQNQRSMLGVHNLCDLIMLSMQHPNAAGQTFLAADDEPMSTPEFFRLVAAEMNVPARVFPFPPSLLRLAARVLRKTTEIDRLCSSLLVNSDYTKSTLDWSPRLATADGIRRAVNYYLRDGRTTSE